MSEPVSLVGDGNDAGASCGAHGHGNQVVRPRNKGDVPDDPLSRLRHSASHVSASVDGTPATLHPSSEQCSG